MIYGYIGSGILIKNVAANNNKSFSYNQFLINAYETEDLGSVSSILLIVLKIMIIFSFLTTHIRTMVLYLSEKH